MSRVRQFVFNNAVGLLALVVALGGTSYAVTSKRFVGADGKVHACARTKTGAVRLVTGSAKCRRGEQKVAWSRTGPAGTPGRDGAAGPAGSIQGAPAGGDLTGTYPNPALAPAAAPVGVAAFPGGATNPCFDAATVPPLVYCGTDGFHWENPDPGATGAGVQIWRDRLGLVHMNGEADFSSGDGNGSLLFSLPPDMRPKRLEALSVTTAPTAAGLFSSGSGVLIVDTNGLVELSYSSLHQSSVNEQTQVVFMGDVSFRTDA